MKCVLMVEMYGNIYIMVMLGKITKRKVRMKTNIVMCNMGFEKKRTPMKEGADVELKRRIEI